MPAAAITIAIVEDDTRFRETLERVLRRQGGFAIVGAWSSGEAALPQLLALRPQIVLMDIHLPAMSGIECTARLSQQPSPPQVLMLTVYQETEKIFNALQAGASGYLLKRSTPAQIIAAIADVLDGGSPMTSQIARMVVQSFRKPTAAPDTETEKLTPREEEILRLASQGYVPKEIAEMLNITLNTTRTHLKKVYEKLHVRSRTEAVIKYLK